MELISGFFFVVIIGIVSYVFTRQDKAVPINNNLETYDELERRKDILAQVDLFLNGAVYLNQIGNWNKEKIYQYILNQGKVYEFDEFMIDHKQRIGIDDNWLCFKKMAYKRNYNISEIELKK